MLSYAWAHVVVTDADQAYRLARIVRQAVQGNAFWQIVACDELERDGQILLYQFVHAPLNLFLLLTAGLVIEQKTHLALLPFHMGIMAALTAEQPDHGLIQQMLGCVSRWELILVVIVQDIVHCDLFQF